MEIEVMNAEDCPEFLEGLKRIGAAVNELYREQRAVMEGSGAAQSVMVQVLLYLAGEMLRNCPMPARRMVIEEMKCFLETAATLDRSPK